MEQLLAAHPKLPDRRLPLGREEKCGEAVGRIELCLGVFRRVELDDVVAVDSLDGTLPDRDIRRMSGIGWTIVTTTSTPGFGVPGGCAR